MMFERFTDPIFGQSYAFARGPYGELQAWLDDAFPGSVIPEDLRTERHSATGARWSVSNAKGDVTQIVWIESFDGSVADHGLLMHECLHAAVGTCGRLGIEFKRGNDEAFCYYAEYIFERCLQAVRDFGDAETKRRRRSKRRIGRVRPSGSGSRR